jgi:hypothetical protein
VIAWRHKSPETLANRRAYCACHWARNSDPGSPDRTLPKRVGRFAAIEQVILAVVIASSAGRAGLRLFDAESRLAAPEVLDDFRGLRNRRFPPFAYAREYLHHACELAERDRRSDRRFALGGDLHVLDDAVSGRHLGEVTRWLCPKGCAKENEDGKYRERP